MSKARRLVLFLDGTWNEDAVYDQDTNVVRLRNIIANGITNRFRVARTIDEVDEGESAALDIESRSWGEFDYIFFYERGVGTGPGLDRMLGGALGWGLSKSIRRAYKFLSRYYDSDSQVFIFGFSRGAYTARSLVGYLGSAGLLQAEHCTSELEQEAWAYYRTTPNDRLPGVRKKLEAYIHPGGRPRVHCLGLFDTVGTLGVPASIFRRLNRQKYEFHDVDLSPIVKLNLHALAIDERRSQFGASVWRQNLFKASNSITEQTWFPGAHADIGGGYLSSRERRASGGLDDISLDWMLKRIRFHYPDFPIPEAEIPSAPARFGVQHESRSWRYRFSPLAIRAIGNLPPPVLKSEVVLSCDRDSIVVGESIHISAIERLGQKVPMAGRSDKHYLPRNLIEHIPNLYVRYCVPQNRPWGPEAVSITLWDGNIIYPTRDNVCEEVRQVLEEACSRMKFLGFDILSDSWNSTKFSGALASLSRH